LRFKLIITDVDEDDNCIFDLDLKPNELNAPLKVELEYLKIH